jgi:predicted DCC family thiol-disulfide oxidoreductase YuxK
VKVDVVMIPIFSTIDEDYEGQPARGWVLYDGECGICARMVWWFGSTLKRRGYRLVPLQAPWVVERLGMPTETLLEEMRVLTADGVHLSGADAIIYLARRIWWATPLYAMSLLPGVLPLLHTGYRWFAARRHCFSPSCALSTGRPARRFEERRRGRRAT